MKCGHCRRRFRSAAAYGLYRRRLAVLESLRDETPCAHLEKVPADRPARHRKASQHWKQHGEKVAA